MRSTFEINGRVIGPASPVYIVAEMSANHHGDFDRAVDILKAAKEAGADAVKLQTYTPDTMTLDCDNEYFRIVGTPWHGKRLYQLYSEAYTRWEWHGQLVEIAADLGLQLFSTPFDATAVEYLEGIGVPAYKISSFELVDVPLLQCVARTGKPIIVSTGMATLAEIEEAVGVVRDAGGTQLALLKCTSAYPADPDDMNLHTIPHLAATFGIPVGISDHTLDVAVPVAAVALGACIVEKHLTLSRNTTGPDSTFSLEPDEFRQMVTAVRAAGRALGSVCYGVSDGEAPSQLFRRSLFVIHDMTAGDMFTQENVRAIRPGHGLHTRHLPEVLGRHAARNIPRGTPLNWDLLAGDLKRVGRSRS